MGEYSKTAWVNGTAPALNSTNLNNIEDGIEEINNGSAIYVVTTGSANTYIATFTDTFTSYVTGLTLRVKFNVENTSTSTLNVDTLGAKTIKKVTGAGIEVLEAGDIVLDGVYILVYNGTDFIMANQIKTKPMIQVFTSSGTFNAPFTGNYKVTTVGGGGAGSSTSASGDTINSGGGSAGWCKEIVSLTKADAVTVTIGAGGVAPDTTSGGDGGDGGTSSFGAYMSSAGGSGGTRDTSDHSGGSGGTCSGGDINITGNIGRDSSIELAGYKTGHPMMGESYGYGGKHAGGGFSKQGGDGGDGIVIVEWTEG